MSPHACSDPKEKGAALDLGDAMVCVARCRDFWQADGEGGVAATVRSLQMVAAERKGTAEELVALFVALLRSAGILVRFVRCQPLPSMRRGALLLE